MPKKVYFLIMRTIIDTLEICWWRFSAFFVDFIIPGRLLRRMIFSPGNCLRIPQLKSWNYCDPRELMVYANMQVLEKFWSENPEEIVCWKLDEKGEDVGPRVRSTAFPEIDGMYAIDVLHKVDDLFKKTIPELQRDCDMILSLQRFLAPKIKWKSADGIVSDFPCGDKAGSTLVEDYSSVPKVVDDEVLRDAKFTEEEITVFHKYFGKNFKRPKLTEQKVTSQLNELDTMIEMLKNRAIHYMTEARTSMWT